MSERPTHFYLFIWFLFGKSKIILKHHFRCCKGKRKALLLFQSVFVVVMNLRVLKHDNLVIVTAYERFISRTLISLNYMRLERCENVCCIMPPNCRISIYFQNEMQKRKIYLYNFALRHGSVAFIVQCR